jgi:alpha-aminoadipic semialdehyde synthase
LQDSKGSVNVEVESCLRRSFTNMEYENAGALVVPRLSADADVVLGIKEPPVEEVLALNTIGGKKKTWMVFSHTHKGQVGYSLPPETV